MVVHVVPITIAFMWPHLLHILHLIVAIQAVIVPYICAPTAPVIALYAQVIPLKPIPLTYALPILHKIVVLAIYTLRIIVLPYWLTTMTILWANQAVFPISSIVPILTF